MKELSLQLDNTNLILERQFPIHTKKGIYGYKPLIFVYILYIIKIS